jgi:hypothetical protein
MLLYCWDQWQGMSWQVGGDDGGITVATVTTEVLVPWLWVCPLVAAAAVVAAAISVLRWILKFCNC